MALLAAQQVQITGTTITFSAANAGGDTVSPDDRAMLEVKNTDGTAKTVTVVVPGTKFEQPLADVAVVVDATTGHKRIGPLTADLADTDGFIDITYSAVTGVTVAIVRA
jgi:hypothetical protein